jgi:hypothetical protein
MMPLASMFMNRTFRPGSYSSGRPVWRKPITPWASSPVRMSMIELVCPSLIGILLHGNSGTPRQDGTWWPPTSTLCG